MQNPVFDSKKKGDAADRILNPSADKHKMKEINNIADTTGRATYQSSPTKISPAMEQLYFEMEDKEHVFQIGLKTILECILFGAKEKQLPDLPLSWYTEVCSRYDIPMSELFGEEEDSRMQM